MATMLPQRSSSHCAVLKSGKSLAMHRRSAAGWVRPSLPSLRERAATA